MGPKASPSRCLVDSLEGVAPGAELTLGERARHHLDHVRRLRDGDPVELRDGRGGAGHAAWLGRGRVRVTEVLPPEPPPVAPLWLAVAPPRLPRLDWLVEKATELGVCRLLLLESRHGQHEVRDGRLARLERKADAALLQCGRRHALQLAGPLTLEALLGGERGAGHEAGARPAALWLAAPDAPGPPPAERPAGPLLALVGPEGGFHADETRAAVVAGARPVRLGPHVLRVETAALALAAWASACALAH